MAVRLAHDDRLCPRRPGHHRAGPLDVLQRRAQSSWESVYYLQYQVIGGWLLRAIHFYTGQATLVLVGIYLVQMILRGAYRAPREFLFWTVLLMGLATLGLNLTGDLLAWDQNSFWATSIRVGLSFAPARDRSLAVQAGDRRPAVRHAYDHALPGPARRGLHGALCWHWYCSTPTWLRATVWKRPADWAGRRVPARSPIGRSRPGATRRLASSCWRSSWGCRRATVFPARRPASNWAPRPIRSTIPARPGPSGRSAASTSFTKR